MNYIYVVESTETGAVSELMGDGGSKTVCLGMKIRGENSVKKIIHPAQDRLQCMS